MPSARAPSGSSSGLDGSVYEIDPAPTPWSASRSRPATSRAARGGPRVCLGGRWRATDTVARIDPEHAIPRRRPDRGRRATPPTSPLANDARLGRERGRRIRNADHPVELPACVSSVHTLRAALLALALAACARPESGERGEVRRPTPRPQARAASWSRPCRSPGARAQEPRVVLSLGPGKLGGLERGGRLELSSEVQLTVDCDKRSRRCAGRPYRFDPRLTVTLEVGKRRSARRQGACDRPPHAHLPPEAAEPPAPLPGRLRQGAVRSARSSRAGCSAASRTSSSRRTIRGRDRTT